MGFDVGREGYPSSRKKRCSWCFTLLKRAPTAKPKIPVRGKATEKLLLRTGFAVGRAGLFFSLHRPSKRGLRGQTFCYTK